MDGSGTGTFTSSIADLTPNTTYYVRAYATNSAGTAYGNERSFTTATLPSVTTASVSSITINSAQSGGSITDDGGSAITAKGVCWSTSPNPTLVGFSTNDGTGIGAFISNLTGLSINTTYYVRAYATNSIGTAYGSEISFTTKDGIPIQTTTEITNITATTATSGGNITDDGGATITTRGVCWSTTSNPTLSDSYTTDGTGTGSFTSNITGLTENTTYYIRAYATNSIGTNYGNEIEFTTKDGIPTLTTTEITDITATTATSGGNITDDGGFEITARGVCWSTSSEPTLADNYTEDGTGTGSFTSSLTGLTEWNTYYVRAYATNENGTVYGDEISFEAKETLTDYDGNVYQTVQIGNQTWMAENLKTTHYADGTEISLVEDSTAWDALSYTDIAYCYYDNSTSNANTYGALYNWRAAMNGATSSSANPSGVQGACPDGWHLPGDDEWKELEMYLGMSQTDADATGWRGTDEGGKLKETGTTHWNSPNTGATNESGFMALPAGYRVSHGRFDYLGNFAYFWSATEYSSSYGWNRYLYYNISGVYRHDRYGKTYGFSVRCVKD